MIGAQLVEEMIDRPLMNDISWSQFLGGVEPGLAKIRSPRYGVK